MNLKIGENVGLYFEGVVQEIIPGEEWGGKTMYKVIDKQGRPFYINEDYFNCVSIQGAAA